MSKDSISKSKVGDKITFTVNLVTGGMMMFSYKFTVSPLVLALMILYWIVLVIPEICFKKVSEASIVEVLREVE